MQTKGTIIQTKDYRNFIFFYLGWFLYFTQGILGLRGAISQTLFAIMLIWSILLFYKVNKSHIVNPCLKILNYLVLMYFIYGMWQLIIATEIISTMIDYPKKAAFSILPIYGYYYFFKKIKLEEKWLMVFIVGLLLFSMGEYYDGLRTFEADPTKDTDQIVNSSTYRFLPIFPLLFFVRSNSWFKYCTIIIVLVFVIMGTKRGPIVISIVCLLIFIVEELKSTGKKIKLLHLLFFLIVCYGGSIIVSKVILNNDFFLYRMEQMLEGDSSGRDDIYSRYMTHFFNESNVFYLIFGNGADATRRIFTQYAHNDWIEIAINNGIMGLLIYFTYYFTMFKQWRKAKPAHELYLCFGVMILISLMTSFFSMSINNQRISAHFCIGYCLALIDRIHVKQQKQNKKESENGTLF